MPVRLAGPDLASMYDYSEERVCTHIKRLHKSECSGWELMVIHSLTHSLLMHQSRVEGADPSTVLAFHAIDAISCY